MTIAERLQTIAENEQKIFEIGKLEGESLMWDAIQDFGKRNNYSYAFCGWGLEYLHPKYKIAPTYRESLNQIFSNSLKLKKIEGKYFDFSNKQDGSGQDSCYWTFGASTVLEEIEDIGISAPTGYYSAFNSCLALHTIAVVRSHENTSFSGTFGYCYALKNVTFEGLIGQNISMSYSSKLSKASMQSLINALATTSTGKTVTLSLTAVNTAFETSTGAKDGSESAEWLALRETKSNWTISTI